MIKLIIGSLLWILMTIYTGSLDAQPIFEDVTADHGFLVSQSSDVSGSGVAVGDFDNDGDPDVFVCGTIGNADRLYRNDNGLFVDISASVGFTAVVPSRMAIWVDIDNDGWLDVVVAGDCDGQPNDCPDAHHLRLFRQNNGMFEEISESAGLFPYGAKKRVQTMGGLAAADINNDGYMDFVQAIRNGKLEVFINQRNNTFNESALSYGFGNKEAKYYQIMFHDFNNDGFVDLYANVDFGPNQFWIQETDGTFAERGFRTWSDNSFNEMGMTLGDVDRDGDLDIYATNIANYLGQNVHNILLRNDFVSLSDFRFTEVSKSYGIDQGGWGWGAVFFDADNDGLLDLATTNGFNLGFETVDASKMWMQTAPGVFQDVSAQVQFNDNLNGHCLVSLDFDKDGDLDMIQTIKTFSTPRVTLRLLENSIQESSRGNFLIIEPRMNQVNHYAIGAVVTAYVGEIPLVRLIHTGTSMYGQEAPEAFIGLGSATLVDSLSIRWPGGETSWWYDLEVNERIQLTDEAVVHAPSGLKAIALNTSTWLTWNDYATNETGYRLLRSNQISFVDATEILLPPNTTGYLDENVAPDTKYFYKLQAFNDAYSSRFSQSVELTTKVLSVRPTSVISIHPNPVRASVVHVRSADKIEIIQLFDIQGRQMLSFVPSDISHYDQEIKLEGIVPGVYLLVVNGLANKLMIR